MNKSVNLLHLVCTFRGRALGVLLKRGHFLLNLVVIN